MSALWETLAEQFQAYSVPEAAAVALAVGYLVLVIRQNIACWICAAISSAIYVWLFISAKLYMEAALYLFYVGMAVYGWWVWYRGAQDQDKLPIACWRFRIHLIAAVAIVTLAAVSGALLNGFTDAAYPYIDSFTTFAAVWATFLVARKVFENWWYWLLIDALSIFIYWSRDLQLTALLFVFYVVLIPVGMCHWWRSFRQQASASEQ